MYVMSALHLWKENLGRNNRFKHRPLLQSNKCVFFEKSCHTLQIYFYSGGVSLLIAVFECVGNHWCLQLHIRFASKFLFRMCKSSDNQFFWADSILCYRKELYLYFSSELKAICVCFWHLFTKIPAIHSWFLLLLSSFLCSFSIFWSCKSTFSASCYLWSWLDNEVLLQVCFFVSKWQAHQFRELYFLKMESFTLMLKDFLTSIDLKMCAYTFLLLPLLRATWALFDWWHFRFSSFWFYLALVLKIFFEIVLTMADADSQVGFM